MTLSLANLRSELLSHLGVDVTDFPNGNTDLDLLINRSWWEIMDKLDFREKEAVSSYNTIVNQRLYAIGTVFGSNVMDAIRKIAIEQEEDEKELVLDQMTLDVYNNLYNNDNTNAAAQPTHYIRDGSSFYLYPTPDAIYSLTLYYQAILADIPSGGPVIPQSWGEVILYGAIWRGFLKLGDTNRGYSFKKTQMDLINTSTPVKAKELMDDPRAHLEVLGRDY